jgi:superfamily II DNA or RNA helicase
MQQLLPIPLQLPLPHPLDVNPMLNMADKLLKYQVPHFFQLEEILKVKNCVLDASDTGTGKTYVAIALAKSLGLMPFPICPKSVIPNWISVAKSLDVELFGIANYELLKGCKYYTPTLEKVNCPFIDKYKILDPADKTEDDSKKKIIEDFRFSLPNNVLVIFDEAHKCKNSSSITSRLLLSIIKCKCKILLASATISDKLDCFKPFGVVFGFYDDIKKFKMWLRKLKKAREIYYKDTEMTNDQIYLDIIHSKIFPEFGSRMKIKELGSMFPSNQVLTQSYMSSNKEEIQEQYELIKEAFEDLKNKWTRSDGLGKLIRARMKIEMLKVPIMLDIIEEALDNEYSVVVFVNYTDTMNYLAHYFETDCLIHGGQTMAERQDSIDNYQSNKSKIIISIIQAGGVGISLHDIHGGHPRMSVISPTWSGQDMQQALGRIHRAGSKSPALQRIVFCAGTYEERICELIQQKLTNITMINDKDLRGPQFTMEEYEETESDKSVKDTQCVENNDNVLVGPGEDNEIGPGADNEIGPRADNEIGPRADNEIGPSDSFDITQVSDKYNNPRNLVKKNNEIYDIDNNIIDDNDKVDNCSTSSNHHNVIKKSATGKNIGNIIIKKDIIKKDIMSKNNKANLDDTSKNVIKKYKRIVNVEEKRKYVIKVVKNKE